MLRPVLLGGFLLYLALLSYMLSGKKVHNSVIIITITNTIINMFTFTCAYAPARQITSQKPHREKFENALRA